MSNHDPLCPARDPGVVRCLCDEFAKVRADERKRHTVNNPLLLADLRAKVEALPTVGGVTMPYVKGAEHQYEMVYRADVLALIDGTRVANGGHSSA